MTRFLLLLLIISGSASAQTYIRPSKGNALYPFGTTGWNVTSGTDGTASPPYDWTAFDAVRLTIYGVGGPCTGWAPQQYTVSELGRNVKFRLKREGGVYLQTWDAPAPSGPYGYAGVNGSILLNSVFQQTNCVIVVQATPLPFSTPNATVSLPDGGISSSTTVNVSNTCTTTKSGSTSVGTSATAVPADGGLSGRQWVRLCNSAKNSGVPIVTCTSDGTSPDAGIDSDGEALEVGDCSVYPTSSAITCISDTAATRVSTEECL